MGDRGAWVAGWRVGGERCGVPLASERFRSSSLCRVDNSTWWAGEEGLRRRQAIASPLEFPRLDRAQVSPLFLFYEGLEYSRSLSEASFKASTKSNNDFNKITNKNASRLDPLKIELTTFFSLGARENSLLNLEIREVESARFIQVEANRKST